MRYNRRQTLCRCIENEPQARTLTRRSVMLLPMQIGELIELCKFFQNFFKLFLTLTLRWGFSGLWRQKYSSNFLGDFF